MNFGLALIFGLLGTPSLPSFLVMVGALAATMTSATVGTLALSQTFATVGTLALAPALALPSAMVRTLALAPTSVTKGTLDRALTFARLGTFTLALIFKTWRTLFLVFICAFLGITAPTPTSAKMESLSLSPSCARVMGTLTLAPACALVGVVAVTTLAFTNNQS